MLKPYIFYFVYDYIMQPPSGGCVLKPISRLKNNTEPLQPPSGGCVLKQGNSTALGLSVESSHLRVAVC